MPARIFWLASLPLVVLTACQRVTANDAVLTKPNQADVPEVRIDAPWRVQPDIPFRMAVTYYVPADDTSAPPTTAVSADDTGDVTYDPSDFTLKANETKNVAVKVNKTSSGLAELMVTDDCCADPRLSVDAGFRGRLVWDAGTSLESQTSQRATLMVLDTSDHPLPLDAPITIEVRVSGALVRFNGDPTWHSRTRTILPRGSTASPTLDVMPQPLFSTDGAMQVQGFLNDETFVLLDSPLRFKILPPWWVRLGVTILGAIIYGFYQLAHKLPGSLPRAFMQTLLAGIFAGIFAWALADWNVLGIRTDPEHLTGYFVLGILTAVAGVEPMFEKLARRRDGTETVAVETPPRQ
jgi:hypothetical protein